jgi:hypothetical protein
MNKLILPLLVTFLFALVGCSNVNGRVVHSQTKVSQAKNASKEEIKPNNGEPKAYNSITEYHEMLNGENLKTTILKTSSKDSHIFLDMDIKLSPKIKNIMMNTKNKFYFTFTEVEGHDKLRQIIIEEPNYTEGKLENLSSGDILHLSQQKKLKHNPSSEEMKIVLSPENYELAILNEKQEMVAVIIGLELNMVQ